MTILAIETATGSVGVALADSGGIVAQSTVEADRRHVELLHPMIEAVCAEAGVKLWEIDGIGVDVGPGLFTGIRVGVAAAKAMAMALDVKVVGVTSLEALLHGGRDLIGGGVPGGVPSGGDAADEVRSGGAVEVEVVPVVDLRRGEVAWLVSGEEEWGTAERCVSRLSEMEGVEGRVLLVGDGAARYAEELAGPWSWAGAHGVALTLPPVASVAVLALTALESAAGRSAADLEPRYLREADARINWTTRHDGSPERGA